MNIEKTSSLEDPFEEEKRKQAESIKRSLELAQKRKSEGAPIIDSDVTVTGEQQVDEGEHVSSQNKKDKKWFPTFLEMSEPREKD